MSPQFSRAPGPRGHRLRLTVAVLATAALALTLAPPAQAQHAAVPGKRLTIEVLSSNPDQVSGGDALLRVEVGPLTALETVRVTRNGEDVTARFTADEADRTLTGLVDGLRLGDNEISARAGGTGPIGRLTLRNHPVTGPIFSGPQQYPFLCRTEQAELGQPLVDNSEGQGMRVYALDEQGNKTDEVVGWSRDCSAETQIRYFYRTTGGSMAPFPTDGSVPGNIATTTTLDGATVDFVVRRERGTINRFIYQIAMLAPVDEAVANAGADHPDHSSWNGRVIYVFSGGVAIGHNQGTLTGSAMDPDALGLGYALIFSTGTRTNVHYNLQVGGETALMLKEHFIKRHGLPLYTVGVGGSGGAIQQYIYGQNYSRVLDAAIPQYSYPDMVTQTIHIGDCELLEYYMDVTDVANPKWQDWENRTALIGLNASNTVPNAYRGGAPGSTECVQGWRGLTPLALNHNWFSTNPDPLWQHMDPPGVTETVHWTHWDDLRNIYGVGPDGFARTAWDNVGVQYGLQALLDGFLTPEEFLDLNARVGSWKPQAEMVQEGCPFVPVACADPAQFDPWSARNMNLSPDGGVTPAPRMRGDLAAIRAINESGLVFTGDIDIPIIDWRHYLEHVLDMHNTHQSFAVRQRMLNFDGDAGNQLIWFTDARPAIGADQTPEALVVIDQWMANIRANPELGIAGNKPPLAVDRCFDTQGNEIARGDHVWDGILNDKPAGPCTEHFPIYSTSRIVAGAPITGDVYACRLQPVAAAVARGVYGDWVPTAVQRQRLEEIFPTGVCRY
jgi:hypothetical protein